MKGFVFSLIMMVCYSLGMNGQPKENENTTLFVNINTTEKSKVITFNGNTIGFEYSDRYGAWEFIPLLVYNWKQELVAKLKLNKEYGLNHFEVDMSSFGSFEVGKPYTCLFVDETGRKYRIIVKSVEMPSLELPVVDILIDPIQLDCRKRAESIVEFYGDISGGRAPYTINWVVTDDTKSKFLFQPKEEVLSSSGSTSAILVDKTPDYSVLLQVKDACGNMGQKMVTLTCSNRRKKVNTLFFEPLEKPAARNPRINQ